MRDYLHRLRQQQAENKIFLGDGYVDNDYVCRKANGDPFSPDYISRRFLQVLRKNQLPHIRFHDLRHSAASMLLANGFSLKEIQEWLGHGTLSTTANIYAHLQYEAKQDMAVSLGKKLVIG
jgi:integrase